MSGHTPPGRPGPSSASRALVRAVPLLGGSCSAQRADGTEAAKVRTKRQFLAARDVTVQAVARPSLDDGGAYDLWSAPNGVWACAGVGNTQTGGRG
jgi:hypothetical protein